MESVKTFLLGSVEYKFELGLDSEASYSIGGISDG